MTFEIFYLILIFTGLGFAILSGIPVMLAIGGVPLLVGSLAVLTGHFDPSLFGAFPQRLFGMMSNQLLLSIPLFVFMGVILQRSDLAEQMMHAAQSLTGSRQRPLALGVLAMSTLIAAATGIAGATIIMLGLITYPALLRTGIREELASGTVLAAGTLGQIVPPSIVLILLADQISNAWLVSQQNDGVFAPEPVTVSALFAGALVPSLLLVSAYAIYLMVSLDQRHVGNDAGNRQRLDLAGWSALGVPPILILLVLGSILAGVATPTEAAAIGAVGTVIAAACTRRERPTSTAIAITAGSVAGLLLLTVGSWLTSAIFVPAMGVLLLIAAFFTASLSLVRRAVLVPAIWETVLLSGVIFAIIASAAMLSIVFRGFGGDVLVADVAGAIPGGQWTLLVGTLVIVFLLGFILEFIEIILIIVPIMAPVLFGLGVDPVWFAILLAVNLQTSFLTPPFGIALFYFKSVAPPALKTETIYRSVVPFVGLQLAVLAILIAFPETVTGLPDYLFGG